MALTIIGLYEFITVIIVVGREASVRKYENSMLYNMGIQYLMT